MPRKEKVINFLANVNFWNGKNARFQLESVQNILENWKFELFKVLKGKDLHIWNVQIWIFKNLLQKFVMECVSQTLEKSKALKSKVLKENQRLQISKESFLKMSNF